MDLTLGEWTLVACVAVAMVVVLPVLWDRVDEIELVPDHRVPHSLSDDYWYFERYAARAAARADVLLLGDSVIWGAYAARGETLSHHLAARDGRRFANLGINGGHPAALDGILRHHGAAIAGKTVVLHLNLLWLSSPRRDLSDSKEWPFNHEELVPQFDSSISVYRADLSDRIGVALGQGSPFAAWTRHLQQAYFDQLDLPAWTIEHPYRLPLGPAPAPASGPHEQPVAWTRRGIRRQGFAWVHLSGSVQWRFFRNAVRRLLARGNRVIVLVGPFNEHMMTPQARAGYAALRAGVTRWSAAQRVVTLVPAVLPSHLYADASHPLAEGYRLLAARIQIPR